MKSIKIALFVFASNISFCASSWFDFRGTETSRILATFNNKISNTKEKLFINEYLLGNQLKRQCARNRNFSNGLDTARKLYNYDKQLREIEIQYLYKKWEIEQKYEREALWIKNDALRNHLTQYGWHYVGVVTAVVAGYCLYKLVKNKKSTTR